MNMFVHIVYLISYILIFLFLWQIKKIEWILVPIILKNMEK